VEGVLRLAAVEDLLDGEDLQAGVCCAVRGLVEAGFGGFLEHGFGGLLKAEEDADLGPRPQVSEVGLGPTDHLSTPFFFKWSNSVSTRSALAPSNQERQVPRLSDHTSFGVAATG